MTAPAKKPVATKAKPAHPRAKTPVKKPARPSGGPVRKASQPAPAAQPKTPAPRASGYDFIASVGRRKEAVARVRLFRKGSGQLTINGRELTKYFPLHCQHIVLAPLRLIGVENQVDVRVKVTGGGSSGQAEATRHGIARALLKWDENHRKQLRPAGFLTRNARVKERKKPGLKRARRAPQFSKR